MGNKKRYSIKNILLTTVWVSIGAGIIVMLVAGIRKSDAQLCKGIEINISGVNNNFFVDKTDILKAITVIANGNPLGQPIGSLNLKMMESQLEKNTWIKGAELFLDNNNILQVSVHEREPVARVFTSAGSTFYIDEDINILPLSEKFSARLPVFTNFPSGEPPLSKADSNLLTGIKTISMAIQNDSFRMAMIEQVDITQQRTFEMIPKIGNQVIVFGDASATEEKFNKLELFYKKVMVKAGWSNYSIINLQYKNQVVAKIRGAEDVVEDSLRTLQLMQLIVYNAEKRSGDSLQNNMPDNDNNVVDSSMIQQSIQRDEYSDISNTIEMPKPTKQTITQPVLNSNQLTEKKAVKQDPISFQNPKKITPVKTVKQLKKIKPKKNDY